MASGNPHHEGKPKVFDDDKVKGKKEVLFKPSDLNIVWGKDPRYWDVPKNEADKKSAELLQVCWLEVTGSLKNINPGKDYEVIFNLSLTPDAFGWGNCPVFLMVKRGKNGKFAPKRYQLGSFKDQEQFDISCKLLKADNGNQGSNEMYFGLYEVWSGKWKGGLRINSAIVKEMQ